MISRLRSWANPKLVGLVRAILRDCPVALVVFLCLLLAWPVAAQGGIKVIESKQESHFAEKVVFRLTAESDATIEHVLLFRQLAGEQVKLRARPDFTPGKRIKVEYTWELEPGDLAPGAQVSYFWELEDKAGHRLQTAPQGFSYDDDRFQWESVSRGEIVVHYYGGKHDLAEEILSTAEEATQRLQKDVGILLEKPVRIFVYNSRSDMRAALSPRGGVYDAQTVTLGAAMGRNTLLLLGSDLKVRVAVAHELSHIVVGLATDNPYTDLPRWLDEGLAMYAEGTLLPDNAQALQKAIREDRLISVRSLSSYVGKPEQVDLFYGEVYSLVDFLLKTYGNEKLDKLLDILKTGVPIEEALRQAYGFGLDQLDDEWRVSLGLRPRAEMQATPTLSPGSAQRGSPVCTSPLAAAWLVASALIIVFHRR